MAILNKYKKWHNTLRINNRNRWDFILSSQGTLEHNEHIDLCSLIDISNKYCVNDDSLYSLPQYTWDKSINNGVELKNIGLTAIDTGYIKYRGDKITNEDFYSILTNSTLKLNEGDLRLNLKSVNSNNNIYDLSYSFESENKNPYLSLKGGFFQGFFKVHGHEYQILPSSIENYWKIDFKLRLKDYDVTHNSLNAIHPNNKGIFFYIGTRSENKFLIQYNYDLSKFEKREVESNRDFICDDIYCGYYTENLSDVILNPEDGFYFTDDYFAKDYFAEEYLNNNVYNSYFADDEYLHKEQDISNETVVDTNNVNVNIEGYTELKTDNKFLFFDNTKDGFTTDTWENDVNIILTDSKKPKTPNLYLLLNDSTNGFTTDTIDEYYKSLPPEEPSFKDITNNAFALRIKDDGSIGYRYLIDDCESEYKIMEEYSKPNIIKYNEWSNVSVTLKKVTPITMKIYIYVNEKLKLISKEVPILNLREINEYKTKQEGVPYNLSLGGGTMGLCNSLWLNYYDNFDYILPLEKYFAGSFLGDIKLFSFFTKE